MRGILGKGLKSLDTTKGIQNFGLCWAVRVGRMTKGIHWLWCVKMSVTTNLRKKDLRWFPCPTRKARSSIYGAVLRRKVWSSWVLSTGGRIFRIPCFRSLVPN